MENFMEKRALVLYFFAILLFLLPIWIFREDILGKKEPLKEEKKETSPPLAPRLLPAMIVGKLVGGISAVALALLLTRRKSSEI